jgi:ATP-dependent Clp protease ATP-binding subunit ClpC
MATSTTSADAARPVERAAPSREGAASPAAAPWEPRAREPTPALDRFGRDLTRQALAGELTELVGRDSEVARIVETLCRRHKRNPILLGEAGTGKTAIVEGVAQRVIRGLVPTALRGIRILQLQPSTLVAGAGIVGEIETRLKAILEEARQDGIVLFIDEVHAIVGTGGMRGTGDLASLLKPALARGDVACIAATTDDEYRRFIEDDAALERRFTPIVVDELDRAATLAVLRAHRDELGRLRGVDVPDAVLRWLVDFSADGLPNRHFPDKAVDLLEQCVANAVVEGRAAVDRPAAEAVARRLVGVPPDVTSRVQALRVALTGRGLADEAAAATLADRLAVTMRGLDRHRRRPNAVVALAGPAAARGPEVASAMAEALFGNPERVVTLDLGRMTEAHDVAMLVGAPPGYIGYSDRLPIHRLASQPWSILLCDGVDAAHPEVRDLLAEALEDGAFVDGAGRRILLAESVVLLVGSAAGSVVTGPLGFRMPGASEAPLRRPDAGLGSRLAALVDVVIAECPSLPGLANAGRVLADIVARFAQAGLDLEFTPAMAGWLVERAGKSGDIEAAADRDLLPVLARLVGAGEGPVRVEPGPEGRPVTRHVARKAAR